MIALILLSTSGCSAYKAISQPGTADLSGIGIGTPRQQVILRLGPPKMIDTLSNGVKQDVFEFQSGANQSSKVRAVFYVAADVFTVGLAEVILWPLEMTAFDSATCTAMATYDNQLKVDSWGFADKKNSIQNC